MASAVEWRRRSRRVAPHVTHGSPALQPRAGTRRLPLKTRAKRPRASLVAPAGSVRIPLLLDEPPHIIVRRTSQDVVRRAAVQDRDPVADPRCVVEIVRDEAATRRRSTASSGRPRRGLRRACRTPRHEPRPTSSAGSMKGSVSGCGHHATCPMAALRIVTMRAGGIFAHTIRLASATNAGSRSG